MKDEHRGYDRATVKAITKYLRLERSQGPWLLSAAANRIERAFLPEDPPNEGTAGAEGEK